MTSSPDVKRFTELAASPCPAAADLLISLAAEFESLDSAAVHGELDDVARGLFGIARLAEIDQAQRIAAALGGPMELEPVGDDPGGLLIHRVLATRRGHPAMLASVGAELALRAGVQARVYSSLTRWFIGLEGERGVLLLDARLGEGTGHVPGQVRGYCAHELAFCVLTGLAQRYARQGMRIRAQRAERLRRALPVEPSEHGR
jgi:regulator of sirC expression with transglutaminase-like and TPR domain